MAHTQPPNDHLHQQQQPVQPQIEQEGADLIKRKRTSKALDCCPHYMDICDKT